MSASSGRPRPPAASHPADTDRRIPTGDAGPDPLPHDHGGTPGWTLSREGRVATLAFSGGSDNTVTMIDLQQLHDHAMSLAQDRTVSVVAVTGSQPGEFIGHAAAEEIAPLRRGADGRPVLEAWRTALSAITELPQPTVAVVNGPALGGGCELALACTLRVAGPEARFQQVEILRGAIPGAGATQRLPRLVGPGAAALMVVAGAELGPQDALRVGLVDHLVPNVEVARSWIATVAKRPRAALVAATEALRAAHTHPLSQGLIREQDLFLQVIAEDRSTLCVD